MPRPIGPKMHTLMMMVGIIGFILIHQYCPIVPLFHNGLTSFDSNADDEYHNIIATTFFGPTGRIDTTAVVMMSILSSFHPLMLLRSSFLLFFYCRSKEVESRSTNQTLPQKCQLTLVWSFSGLARRSPLLSNATPWRGVRLLVS